MISIPRIIICLDFEHQSYGLTLVSSKITRRMVVTGMARCLTKIITVNRIIIDFDSENIAATGDG